MSFQIFVSFGIFYWGRYPWGTPVWWEVDVLVRQLSRGQLSKGQLSKGQLLKGQFSKEAFVQRRLLSKEDIYMYFCPRNYWKFNYARLG